MKVLYIGGTGEVSYGCIQAGLELGQQITVYNRGTSGVQLPNGARHISGDVTDETAYQSVGRQKWDAVCQFRSFDMQQCQRDIRAFAGNVGQFVFISTAMVYQRPPVKQPVIESSPRGNPHSPDYAQKKIAIEDHLMELHRSKKMPLTIVRPSHTIRTRMPGAFVSDDEVSWRMIHGKPIVCHGDGSSLWALTRCEDFGRAFAKLLGNPKAMGEAFHITTDQLHPWDAIHRAWAMALGRRRRGWCTWPATRWSDMTPSGPAACWGTKPGPSFTTTARSNQPSVDGNADMACRRHWACRPRM